MRKDLEVAVTSCGAEQWVRFTGNLLHGTENAGKARRMLLGLARNDNSRIILDLRGVTHIDAAGVEAIALAAATAREHLAAKVEIWRMPDFARCPLALQVRLHTACEAPEDLANEPLATDKGREANRAAETVAA